MSIRRKLTNVALLILITPLAGTVLFLAVWFGVGLLLGGKP